MKLYGALILGAASAALAGNPLANSVVSYFPGSNPVPGYTDPNSALGDPTRYTGVGVFPSAVTPFNPPFLGSEVVSIGVGGSLTLRFDQPIANDPLNPYGVDLLIFGNAFYNDASYPSGIVDGIVSAGRGQVDVSMDGTNWFTVPGRPADAEFPTLGYTDLTDPYALSPGNVLSDFTRPVNPALNTAGMTFAQLVAAYNGSGGGSGVDLASVGLPVIQFVRIVNPAGSNTTVEIDAVTDVSSVPTPGACVVLGAAAHDARRSGLCRRRSLLQSLSLAATSVCAAQDYDWSTLGGGASRASGTGTTLPVPLGAARWVASQDEQGLPITFAGQSGVVTRLGRVYALGKSGGVNRLFCVTNDSGQVLWGQPVPAPAFESWTTPTIDDLNGTVLVAAGAFLTAINSVTGAVAWQTPLDRNTGGATPVVSVDRHAADRAFITDYDGFGGNGKLYCINVDSFNAALNPYQPGQVVWKVPLGCTGANSPAYFNGIVYVASVSDVSGVSPGQIRAFPANATSPPEPLWTFTNPVNAGFFGGVSLFTGSPVHVYAASYVFSGGQLAANLVKVAGNSGTLVWSIPCNRTDTIPVLMSDGTIAVSSGIRGFGSIPSIEYFRDNGSSVSMLWDSALDSWVDTNGNMQMDPGEYLDVGGWTVQPIGVRIAQQLSSPHRLYTGILPAGTSTANACAGLKVLDLTRLPSDPGFVLDTSAGAGSTPAATSGGMLTVGPAGLHALGKRYCYANCDGSSSNPILTANDFQCFLGHYAVGSFDDNYSLANCDGSNVVPIMNANDFQCMLNAFAAGCS